MSVPPPIPVHITRPELGITADSEAPKPASAAQAAITHIHVVAPHEIDLSAGAQMREQRSESTVDEYAEAMRGGAEFPMPVVYCERVDAEGRPLSALILADGFHRVAAARRANLSSITVELRQGTRREATLYAVGANKDHGLRPSQADVRKAITTLLCDEEWKAWSDREIARRTGASHSTVGRIRKGLGADAEVKERRFTRDGEERTFTVKDAPAEEVEAAAGLFPAEWPAPKSPALPPFPNGSPAVPARIDDDPFWDGLMGKPPPADVAHAIAATCTNEPDVISPADSIEEAPATSEPLLTIEDEGDVDVYAVHRRAAEHQPERKRRKPYPAITRIEENLPPHLRHLLRRWVWTHGEEEGLPSVARLSNLPHRLDGSEDGEDPMWQDLDSSFNKLIERNLLERRPNGTIKAPRIVYRAYTAADRVMVHMDKRQDDWARHRADAISEAIGGCFVSLHCPMPGTDPAIEIHFKKDCKSEEGGVVEIFASAPATSTTHGRTYEGALEQLEALFAPVLKMKGVK